ncbi:hypothetical protein BJX63DRAFT_233838 [Aspergillus granulosus]|uniref:Zn(2)-C6 fungal-type domain-containing protein n=1 Tax=Aspergillus granulosus TaxID=176169 RepID=A0ABR4HC19_9EURO
MVHSQACDRCHSLKALCLPGPAGNCYRCYRLHHKCTFSRRRGKRGPKPRLLTPSPSQSSNDKASETSLSDDVPRDETITQNRSTQEPTLATIPHHETLLMRISVSTALGICSFFSFGPQLSMEMYRIIRARVADAPLLLLRPYVAVSRVFLRCNANETPCSNTDWSACASALQTLRNAEIMKPEHIGSFLALGMSLVTFHRLISGISASTICRFTLSLVRPYYYANQLSDSDSMELMCLIFLDTTQSLFRARVPVIEYKVRDPFRVDQHAGLCGSLLPLLYQVCLLAAAMKTRKGKNIPAISFDKLKEELQAWSPNPLPCALERFSDEETLLLITQANVHRAGALLYLHRLRYPFGENDEEAEELSKTIITEMEYCLNVVGQFPPNMTLILLFAGAEVRHKVGRQRILFLVSQILGSSFYPFIANLRLFLWRVWTGRDQGKARYLSLLFEEDPELSIPL